MLTEYSVKVEALENELRELGRKIRDACCEMECLLDDGMIDREAVDEQFRWIWTLKRRRDGILRALGSRKAKEGDGNVD